MKFFGVRAVRACCLTLVVAGPVARAADAPSPLTLRQAVEAALDGNPGLATFAFDLRAQDARIRQAGLRPPTEVSIAGENMLGSGETRGLDAAEFTLALSQVVELGGKRDARIAAARAGRGVLDVERQARQLDVLAEVTRRFIAVATAQERLALARVASDLAERTVAASERRVAAAKAPHAELDRARVARERARLDERAIVIEADNARLQLAATWGETQPVVGGRRFNEVRADLYTLPPPGDFAALAGQLAGNPDLLRFASEARLRDAQLRLATTLRRPDLALSGGVRRVEASDDQAFVVSLAVPLFSGRRAQSYVAEVQAQRGRVDADRRATEVAIQAALYELYNRLRRAVEETRALQDDIVPRTEEALKETEYAYQRGRYGYIELADAQREFLAVRGALIDSAAAAQGLRTEIERLTNAPLANAGIAP